MNTPEIIGPGTAAVCGNTVYCMAYSSDVIHGYLVDEDQWKIKLNFPRSEAALTNIKGILTGVGGSNSNELTSWNENGWEKMFNSMSVQRCAPAVVSNHNYVIVAGGHNQINDDLTSIELFDVYTENWATIVSLPRPFHDITAAFCEGRLYVGTAQSFLFSSQIPVCSIAIESIMCTKCHRKLESSELSTEYKWRECIHTPIGGFTLSAIGDQVVVVGGKNVYELEKCEWVKVGCRQNLPIRPIVAVLPGNRMLAFGGKGIRNDNARTVELAVFLNRN